VTNTQGSSHENDVLLNSTLLSVSVGRSDARQAVVGGRNCLKKLQTCVVF
jgi:hypothetical protein